MSQRVGFWLLPGFHLLEWAGLREALGAANALDASLGYEERLLSADGAPVACSMGRNWAVDSPLASAGPLAALFVVAPRLPHGEADAAACATLAALAPRPAVVGGIGSGAGWLAATGLLDGGRCTVRWADVAELAQRHPAVIVSAQLYEPGATRPSAAGGGASLDLALHWLGQRHGPKLQRELLAHFGLARLRPADERQGASRAGAGSTMPPKLSEAVALMEANLAEPLATDDVAQLVGVSRRQLERLFKQHLSELPARWYMQLRLARARRLLQDGPQSILQIGLACGFASAPHFSRAYRAQYGHTPRDERAQRAAAWRAAPASPPFSPAATAAEEAPDD